MLWAFKPACSEFEGFQLRIIYYLFKPIIATETFKCKNVLRVVTFGLNLSIFWNTLKVFSDGIHEKRVCKSWLTSSQSTTKMTFYSCIFQLIMCTGHSYNSQEAVIF